MCYRVKKLTKRPDIVKIDSMRAPISETSIHDYLERMEPLVKAFDLLADHVVITDSNANILYANKAVEKKTGFSPEECIGKNPADLWGGNMSKDFYEKMWHTIKTEKKPFAGDVHNKRKDGTEYWQEVHISPILNEKGDVLFFIGIEPDITTRKEREKFSEEFASIIGHQLKNPLTAILWTLRWIMERGGLDKEQEEAIKNAYRENKNLAHLIGDLLTLSSLNKGMPNKESYHLARAIQEIIDKTQKRFPGISFTFAAHDDFTVSTYSSLASQIFENIISNAAEYSHPDMGAVHISLTKKDGQYIFSCADNGIGIPEHDQPNIFKQFFRASNVKETKESGTGLGLFIAKTIADTLGWEISFTSAVGKGTTFFVTIPVQ